MQYGNADAADKTAEKAFPNMKSSHTGVSDVLFLLLYFYFYFSEKRFSH